MTHHHNLSTRRQASAAVLAVLLSSSSHMSVAQTALDTAALVIAVEADRSPLPRTPSSIGDDQKTAVARLNPLRHLPASSSGRRVQGETGELTWRVYLTDDEAATVRAFRLAYQTAVSVLPNGSSVELRINDTRIDRRAIAAPSERQAIELAIQPGTLRPGVNTVSLRIDQRHRVDCTREAAYELWTEIDPAETGFVTPVPRAVSNLSDLHALRVRADGALVIRVLFQGRIQPQRLDQTIRAAQAIGIAGGFEQTLVSFVADVADETGINLIVGIPGEVTGLAPSVTTPIPANPGLSLQTVGGSLAPTLIVSGRTDDDIAEAIERIALFAKRDLLSIETGKATQDIALRVTGGERVRLDTANLPDTDFTGRLFRLPLALEMPADFLPADYDKLVFALSGHYDGELTDPARLTIHINGRDAASVPLPKPSKSAFSRNDIGVPLSFFRPGRNAIEIVADLPDRIKGLCSETSAAGNPFRLLGQSEIRIPHLARIAQMPALDQMAAGGFPYATPGATPKLYVPVPDRDALAAAATLAVKLSVAADRLIPFQVVFSNPDLASDQGLVVAPAQALDPALMRAIELDPDAVQQLWQQRGSARDARAPQRTDNSNANLDWLTNGIAAIRTRLFGGVSPLAIAADTSLIVAQGYRARDNLAAITIVTAPDSATLARSVAGLVGPQRWSALSGRLTTMTETGRLVQAIEPVDIDLIRTQPASLRNTRLIVAGWLSLHPAAYVASALLIAALLAAASMQLVKHLGRRNS